MDILISIAAKISEYTVAPIGRQLGYLCFYRDNVDELKRQIEGLRDHKERLQRKVDRAIRNGEEIEADVEKLMTHVTNIIDDFARVFEKQANTKCFAATLPNVVLRYRLSRKAKKMAQIVDTQIKSIKDFIPVTEVSYCPDPDPPSSLIKNKDYEEFESRKQTMKEIIEALRDPNVHVVGACGMDSIGKTMLAKEVARKAKDEEMLFTEVVFTTISQTPNIENIQQDILKSLGMDQSLQHIAERLQNRLRKENKMLGIVDDVWDKLDLEDVGISFGDDKKGYKILVTSRYYGVLNNKMDVDKIFQVGYLLGDEPNKLFKKIVGDQAEKDDNLGTQIVEECGGLPIAITTVASAIKTKSFEVWRNALHELRQSNPVNIEGMHQKVYSCIKLSYDFLESEAKSLFLLCSLFEEDERIDNIKDDDQYPETLKSPNLKLLRLMRPKPWWPMENSEAQLPHHFLEGLNELLILHFQGVSIKELPTSSFYRLQTLRLNYCTLEDITWIGELKNLKILNLSCSSIPKQLPRAVGNLKRLLSLELHTCDIEMIPPNVISSLTLLEELNLEDSFKNWEVEGVLLNGDDRQNANLSEVQNLPNLTN